eukprot:GFUD01005117.1.p1 GENE.GFUD01005117.1~~GFUD01005117.1.p1  ORF type:complete len:447 (+),score=147.56 GFUD01005117.1:211-1551(+)
MLGAMALTRSRAGVGLGNVVVRRCHSDSGWKNRRNVVSGFIARVMDNPLPLGVGALVVGILQLRRIMEREKRKEVKETDEVQPSLADPWQVTCYRSLPLRHVSRVWGAVNELHLPNTVRRWVLGAYVRTFGCDLTEAENSDLDSYENLGQFFRRRLKEGVRVVEEGECLVSPCDGRVLHWGQVGSGGLVEQVKGVTYKIEHFLGQSKDPTGVALESVTADKQAPDSDCVPPTCLYQCVLYLAPGDYHCFHSPADWQVTTRRHFPGELLSVSPGIVRRVQGLFSINERVAYLGRWKHGFFSMTAVGATNVGSVKVGLDPDLTTNTRRWEVDTFHQQVWEDGVEVKKGEYFGEFNLGSTVVLIFEAPENFKFNFGVEGEVVKMGRSIGEHQSVIDEIKPSDESVIEEIENTEDTIKPLPLDLSTGEQESVKEMESTGEISKPLPIIEK